MLNLSYVILYVQDVRRSVAFYRQVFGCQQKFISPEGDYAELASGTTTLAFAVHKLAASNLPQGYRHSRPDALPCGFEIGFESSDIAAVVQTALSAGATEYQPAEAKAWGQTVAYIRDPDGFLVAIGSPLTEQ